MFTSPFQPMNYLKSCQCFHKIRAYCLSAIFFEYALGFSSNKQVSLQQILSHLLQLWLQLWQTSRAIYSASFKATQNQQATWKVLSPSLGSHISLKWLYKCKHNSNFFQCASGARFLLRFCLFSIGCSAV